MNGTINAEDIRTQTTVSVSKEALDTIDEVSRSCGVSRSRLFDMAIRRFASWAGSLHPDALRQIAEYETQGRTTGYIRKHGSGSSYKAVGQAELEQRATEHPESETRSGPPLRKTKGYSEAPPGVRVKRDR